MVTAAIVVGVLVAAVIFLLVRRAVATQRAKQHPGARGVPYPEVVLADDEEEFRYPDWRGFT